MPVHAGCSSLRGLGAAPQGTYCLRGYAMAANHVCHSLAIKGTLSTVLACLDTTGLPPSPHATGSFPLMLMSGAFAMSNHTGRMRH